MSQFTLKATERQAQGSQSVKQQCHKQKRVPGIIYGGKKQPQMISVCVFALEKMVHTSDFHHHILTLDIDGKQESVLCKAVQWKADGIRVQHLDFMRVSANQAIVMNVALHFIGADANKAIKNDGGQLEPVVNEVAVKCLAKHLPDHLEVNVTDMAMNQVLHFSDLKLPKGVEWAHVVDAEHNPPVVAIHPPHQAKEPEVEVAQEVSDDAGEASEDA